jgi:hypothetical protein
MASGVFPFANVFSHLRQSRDAQVGLKFMSADGTTGLTILPVRPEMVTVNALSAEIMLTHGLGRLTLHAHDITAFQKIPTSDAWRLEFGPLIVNIEFGGNA